MTSLRKFNVTVTCHLQQDIKSMFSCCSTPTPVCRQDLFLQKCINSSGQVFTVYLLQFASEKYFLRFMIEKCRIVNVLSLCRIVRSLIIMTTHGSQIVIEIRNLKIIVPPKIYRSLLIRIIFSDLSHLKH